MKRIITRFLVCVVSLILIGQNALLFTKANDNQTENLILKPDTTSNGRNYFAYYAHEGRQWTPLSSEAYIDLGSEDANAEQCYYEIHFFGSAIEVFANKADNHGKVRFSVDGGTEMVVDLYQTSRTEPVSVFKAEKLEEKAHVLKAVTMKEKSGSSIVNQVAYANITHQSYSGGSPVMGGTITDTNTQYTQKRYDEVSARKSETSSQLYAWKNDTVFSELVLYSKECSLKKVAVNISDFTSESDKISKENMSVSFIKSTLAYNGWRTFGTLPEATPANRNESSDILDHAASVTIPWNSIQPVWITFKIPKDTKAGIYEGTVSVTAEGIDTPLTFTYKIHVVPAVLPDASEFKNSFDIELWQYPYTSAEYYNVEPFSEKHLEIMKSSMEKYKEIGGHAITASIIEDAWDGQTYSKNKVHYPSMVKWKKNEDGSFSYDYSDFDAWISFNKSLGLGDKIVLYSIAPWHGSFTYWDNGDVKREKYTVGNARYNKVWTDFLENLVAHLTEKGWFEDTYIGIDEQGFSKTAFDLIESVKNKDGKSLKTAGAMDGFVDKPDLAMRVTDLNVGGTAAANAPKQFEQLLENRKNAGLRTTLYSCTGHKPGNFSLSEPIENYWTIINAGKSKTAGFLRWAYDAWVEDPLRDTTHRLFEPGDCFLIFPDEKNAANPVSKSSVRLEQMAAGVRDMNKINQIKLEFPEFEKEIDALYEKITMKPFSSNYGISAEQAADLSRQMDEFRLGLNRISEQYAVLKAKQNLSDGIANAEKITNSSSYTKERWNTFQEAFEKAKELLENNTADSIAYEKIMHTLEDSINSLSLPNESKPPVQEKPSLGPAPAPGKNPVVNPTKPLEKGETCSSANGYYKITELSSSTGSVIFVKPKSKTIKKLVIPATVNIEERTFQVVGIGDAACKNLKSLKKVTIGKNILTIGKNAFAGTGKLKNIIFKTAKLKKVGKNALKGIHKNCTIKTGRKQYKKYQRLLKKKGQSLSVKIKK